MSDANRNERDDADAKAWFYLDHRHDIETWVALRADARQLLDRHLVGVADRMEELAEEFDAELWRQDLDSGSWPTVGLRRPTWQHDGTVDVSIVIQWERSRLLTPGGNEWPYVAVRLPIEEAGEMRRREVSDAMKPARDQVKGSHSRTYPVWRYIKPHAGAPVDPDELLHSLVTSFRQLWDAAATALDTLRAPVTGLPPR